jgi:hypothetical protein
MKIATVNKGLYNNLIFDVIKYLANQCDHFPVDHTHDPVPKRSDPPIRQEMKYEHNRIEFRAPGR